MRFTLNEKYILNKAKFILNERFILNEDDIDAAKIITDTLNEVSAKLNSILTKISNSTKDIKSNSSILAKIDELIDQAELSNDPEIIKSKISECLELVIDAIGGKNSLNLYPKIKELVTDLQQTANGSTINKNKIVDTLNKLRNLHTELNITTTKDGAVKNGPLSTQDGGRQETKESITKSLEIINNILKNPQLLTGNTKEALANKTALTVFKDSLPKLTDIKNLSNFDNIKNICDNFNSTNFKNVAEVASSEAKDWAALYKECSTKEEFDNFWKDYFTTEWGENANKVNALGFAFVDELKNLGFDAISNPLISYLKANDKLNTFNINRDNYAELHNLISDRKVSLDDIRGRGKFGNDNIIFNKALFDLPISDFKQYLLVQKNLENTDKLPDKEKAANPATILKNLIYADGNINDLTDTKVVNTDKFRSLTAIQQRLEQLGVKGNKKEILTTDLLDKLNALIKDNTNTAKQLLAYLVDYYQNEHEQTIADVLKSAEGSNIVSYIDSAPVTKYSDKQKFNSALGLSGLSLNKNQIREVLISLAKKIEGK